MISKSTEIQIIKFLKEKIPELFGIFIYGSYAKNLEELVFISAPI